MAAQRMSHKQRISVYKQSLNTRTRSQKIVLRSKVGAMPYTMDQASEKLLDVAIKKYSKMANKRLSRIEAVDATNTPAYKALKTRLAMSKEGMYAKGMYAKGFQYDQLQNMTVEDILVAKPRFTTEVSKYGSLEEKRKAAKYLEKWLFSYETSTASTAKKHEAKNIPDSLREIFKNNEELLQEMEDWKAEDIKAMLEEDGVSAYIKEYGWSSYWDMVQTAAQNGTSKEELNNRLQRILEAGISMREISKRTILNGVDEFIRRYQQINGSFTMRHN